MRLGEIERGDGVINRLVISLISLASGIRLPDAARLAFYHKNFFSRPLGTWLHAAMRGPSDWTIGERELMASLIAMELVSVLCRRPWSDCGQADASFRRRRGAQRLQVCTASAEAHHNALLLGNDDAEPQRSYGRRCGIRAAIWSQLGSFEDAIAIGAIFAIVTRCADALNFAIPSQKEFDVAADMLLKRGYRS
jgi:hypothetical protein